MRLLVRDNTIPTPDVNKGLTILSYSAGLFWASEGAAALGYPEPSKRGKYMKYDKKLADLWIKC